MHSIIKNSGKSPSEVALVAFLDKRTSSKKGFAFNFALTTILLSLGSFIFLIAPYQTAHAQEENPAKEMYEAVSAFSKKLDKKDAKHFQLIYSNYNLLETARIVKTDVANAIKACADKNQDMAEELNTKYSKWDASLAPTMEEANGHLENMIMVQNYAKKKELDTIFSLVDKTRNYTQNKFEKVPVTKPEACRHLLETMDNTQEELLNLLRATLVNMSFEDEHSE